MCIIILPPICYVLSFSGLTDAYTDQVEEGEEDKEKLLAQLLWTHKCWPIKSSHQPYLSGLDLVHEHLTAQSASCLLGARATSYYTKTDADQVTTYISTIPTILLFVLGTYKVIESKYYGQGSMTVGEFYALMLVFAIVGGSTGKFLGAMMSYRRSATLLRRIGFLLNLPENTSDRDAVMRDKISCAIGAVVGKEPSEEGGQALCISLQKVGFDYDGEVQKGRLFRNLSVDIPLGHTFAVQGPPGVGKLALMRLLSSVVVPQEGRLIIPGFDNGDLGRQP